MTKPDRKWTPQNLELFHDEQLDSEQMARMREDLLHDAALRAQLAEVHRIDDLMRKVLLRPRIARARRFLAPVRFAAAACLLLVVGASTWLTWHLAGGKPEDPVARIANAPPSPGVRVIFSLPLFPERKTAPTVQSAVGLSVPCDRVFLSRLDQALAAGRIEEALDLLTAATPQQRHEGYRYIAEILRSAQVAESILDRLSLDEQLAVCSQWAAEPTIRPTVFARLQQLSQEPSLANELDSVVAELSADPALRTWLRGYQLLQRG